MGIPPPRRGLWLQTQALRLSFVKAWGGQSACHGMEGTMTRTRRPVSSAPGRKNEPSRLRAFLACEEGATAIEYALMATIFSVTVIGASSSIRSAIQSALTTVTSAIVA